MVNFDEKRERLYRIGEVSTMLGVHPNTIRRWEKQEKIKIIRIGMGHRRIPESEISRILHQTSTTPSPASRVTPGVTDELSDFLNFVFSYHGNDPELVKRAMIVQNKYAIPVTLQAKKTEKVLISPQIQEKPAILPLIPAKTIPEPQLPVKTGFPRHAILDALQPIGLAQRTAFGDLLTAAMILKKFTAKDLATRGKCPDQIASTFCEKMAGLGYAASSDGTFELTVVVT